MGVVTPYYGSHAMRQSLNVAGQSTCTLAARPAPQKLIHIECYVTGGPGVSAVLCYYMH